MDRKILILSTPAVELLIWTLYLGSEESFPDEMCRTAVILPLLRFSSTSAGGKGLTRIFGTFLRPAITGFDELVSESLSKAIVIEGPLPPMNPNIIMKSKGNATLKKIEDGDFKRALRLAFAIALIARIWL